MPVDKVEHANFTQDALHPPNQSVTDFNGVSQNDVIVAVNPYDPSGSRSVSVYEVRSDLANKYAKVSHNDYKTEILDATHTRITKLSSGTINIKVVVVI